MAQPTGKDIYHTRIATSVSLTRIYIKMESLTTELSSDHTDAYRQTNLGGWIVLAIPELL